MLSIKQVLKATNGILLNGDDNTKIKSYKIDSREINKNDFFIPIKGKKVDSHIYLDKVVLLGVIGFFLEETFYDKNKDYIDKIIKENNSINIIIVKDTLKALYEIGKYNRSLHMDIPVIAVTGSVGKTSTKEMISSIFEKEYKVLKTYKNFNGYIGLSLMLLMLDDQDIAVLEHGIDVIGEMKLLAQASKPTYSVITNIGMSHIENFETKENIAKEKLIISDYTEKEVFINGEDDLLSRCNGERYVKYYLNEIKDINQKENITKYKTKIYNKFTDIIINEYGKHNIYNSLVAIKIAEKFNIKVEKIIKGIGEYKNFSKRFEVKGLSSGKIIIDDTYNASYDSFKSGLESLENFKKKIIVVLGDILETGKYAEQLHTNVGKLFSYIKVEEVITYGDNSKYINKEASKYVCAKQFDTKEEIIKYLNDKKEKGLLIYFKASNGMKFSDIVEKID